MTHIASLGVLVLLLASGPAAATATEQLEQQLRPLEALEDWESAYALGLQLADQRGGYAEWRKLAAQPYAPYDQGGLAYLKAWQQAERDRREDQYRDFATLRPQTNLAALAVHRVFQAIDAQPDAAAYVRFMQSFSDYPESLAALTRLHSLLYAKAAKTNTPDAFDRYAATFPEAEQAQQAEDAALRLERDGLAHDLAGADYTRRQQLATALLNQALDDDQAAADPAQAHRRLSALRRFRLLQETPALQDTPARTEQLLRAENIARFRALEALIQAEHDKTRERIEAARQAIIATVTAQHRELQQQIAEQGQTLQTALAAYQQTLDRQLTLIDGDLAQLKGGLEDTRRQLAQNQNRSACQGWVGCGLRVALDLLPGGAYAKLGMAMLAKIPAINQFLKS
ncbi:MAG: hypothetical protein ACKN9T_08145 [Candidatus Methylumidiphilus sp.]